MERLQLLRSLLAHPATNPRDAHIMVIKAFLLIGIRLHSLQQGAVLLGEGPVLGRPDPDGHGAVGMFERDPGTATGLRHDRGQQRLVPQGFTVWP